MEPTQKLLLQYLSSALFGTALKENGLFSENLKKEALQQAVYPLAQITADRRPDKTSYLYLRKNMENRKEHEKLNRLMKENGISYVILKGCASAFYYPNPSLRTMGDVDFLVAPGDIEKAEKVLVQNGWKAGEDRGGNHIGFKNDEGFILEMHRRINGENEKVKKYTAAILLEAKEKNGIAVPSDFHHCLILLCHTASHMISSGIGLRHLCDWAVFASKADIAQWKKELKECGLYRFARILSLLCCRYLGLPYHDEYESEDDRYIEDLMEDILEAGNFGKKEEDRTRQDKYISDRNEYTVSRKHAAFQFFNTLEKKSLTEGKSKLRVITEYLGLIVKGERKPDTLKTIKNANKRKKLYSSLRLFEPEK